jgi:ligand-binding sensor domain-containing protein
MSVALWIGISLGLAATPGSLQVESIRTSTIQVEDLAASDADLWVATRGGVERYDLKTGRRAGLLTTTSGLDDNYVREISVRQDVVEARTLHSRCRLEHSRFSCTPDEYEPGPSSVAPRFMDHRVSARLTVGSREFVGTAGAGLWELGREPRSMTPSNQVCGNHVMAMEQFVDRLWIGSFDDGVCSTSDGQTFVVASGDFRMINHMEVVDGVLYVAASEGLFRSSDGGDFEKVPGVKRPGVNGIAFDQDFIYASTPAALWKLPRGRGRVRADWRPGGTRALQGVEHFGDALWMPSEDRGVIELGSASTRVYDKMVGLPSSWILDIAHDDAGRVYAGTLRHGLWIVDPERNHQKVEGIDDWILEVDRAGDSLWVGTQGGAARIDGETATPIDGLPNPNVHAFEEWRGQIWVATEGGLAIVDP